MDSVELEIGSVELETGSLELETGSVELETGSVELETDDPEELFGAAEDIPEGTEPDPLEELLFARAAMGTLVSGTTISISVGVHPVIAMMAVSKTLVKIILSFFKILSLQIKSMNCILLT